MNTEAETLTLTWTDPESGETHSQEIMHLATIGRGSGATIRLTDRAISRLHARLERVDDRFVLIDTSANGFRVNGEMQKQAALHDGDLLQIGPYALQVHIAQDVTSVESVAVPTEPEATAPADMLMSPQAEMTIDDSAAAFPTERTAGVAEDIYVPVLPHANEGASDEIPPQQEVMAAPDVNKPVVPEATPAASIAEPVSHVTVATPEKSGANAPVVVREVIIRLREQVLVRRPSESQYEDA